MKIDIDCFEEEKRICEFIKKAIDRSSKKGVLIGLSGGVCSTVCAYLGAKALGKNKVIGVFLPERDSNPVNLEHARKVADYLKIKTIYCDLTPFLEQIGIYKLFKANITSPENREKIEKITRRLLKLKGADSLIELYANLNPDENKTTSKSFAKKILSPFVLGEQWRSKLSAFTITKARLRMVILSYYSKLENCLLVSTTDKSEITTGFYDIFGDGVGDIRIISYLYKTQIRQMGAYLDIPKEILDKSSTSDVFAGLTSEFLLGINYEQLDGILLGFEKNQPNNEIIEKVGVNQKTLDGVKGLIKRAQLKENVPYELSKELF